MTWKDVQSSRKREIYIFDEIKGPVVQSMVSLTSSLVVKILTVLVSKISKSQLF